MYWVFLYVSVFFSIILEHNPFSENEYKIEAENNWNWDEPLSLDIYVLEEGTFLLTENEIKFMPINGNFYYRSFSYDENKIKINGIDYNRK